MSPDLFRDALPEPRLLCEPLAGHASNRMPAKLDLAWLAVDFGHAMRHDIRCLTESEGVLKASFRLVHFFTTLAEVVFPGICVSFGGQSLDGVRQGDTGRRLSCGSLTAFHPRPALHCAASRVYRACWATALLSVRYCRYEEEVLNAWLAASKERMHCNSGHQGTDSRRVEGEVATTYEGIYITIDKQNDTARQS